MTASTGKPDRLYVGIDAERTVVGAQPLRMRTGRATRRRFGSITEVVPAVPSGRTRDDRVRFASQLALLLLLLSAVLASAGLPWWTVAAGSAAILGFVTREQARAAAVGTIAVPSGADGKPTCRVLWAPEERAAFARALATAKRIQRTWPALPHMIDPSDADPMLRRALFDLAGVLGRRQEIRRLRAELSAVHHRGLPADSPAVLALQAQRTRLAELWRATGAEANRQIVALNAAAAAGESLIREQQIARTARAAELAIAQLGAAAGAGRAAGPAHPTTVAPAVGPGADPAPEPGGDEAGQDLADRTAAVIDAYRELANRYARGV